MNSTVEFRTVLLSLLNKYLRYWNGEKGDATSLRDFNSLLVNKYCKYGKYISFNNMLKIGLLLPKSKKQFSSFDLRSDE